MIPHSARPSVGAARPHEGGTGALDPARVAAGHRDVGRTGEDAALAALRARGYRILDRNVRLRRGELDIVAQDHETIVFVEVKSRRSAAYGTPAEAVTLRKQRTLVQLAAAYLVRRALCERPCRFDVAEVRLDAAGRVVSVEILRDAFQA